MPVSLTRICPVCKTEKATPSAFRDPGETGAGRPPKVCFECRSKDVGLQLRHLENIANRPQLREYRRQLAARTSAEVLRDRLLAHPLDIKRCPPVGGCGVSKSTADFHTNTHQVDGLSPICAECSADAAALRRDS
ncbi:HNH endonuclease [Microbacterium phage Gretchen]|uniref:Uncharacterized protein n=1 Tax=Microbacterium phage Percival TaxID=2201439 RepID=A0A2Z4Q782_9CAUD|nr:hypothetical protein PBI_PERCIVAL_48 [Microbacterium phage Percival]UDL14821.1 HNH endonuclease [Microbacterium phage Gretchen]